MTIRGENIKRGLIEKLFPSLVYCLIIYGESRWKAQRKKEACNNELWKQGYGKGKLWQKLTKDDESETGSIYRNGKWVCMFKSMIKYRKVQSKGRDELAWVVAFVFEKKRSINAELRPDKKIEHIVAPQGHESWRNWVIRMYNGQNKLLFPFLCIDIFHSSGIGVNADSI